MSTATDDVPTDPAKLEEIAGLPERLQPLREEILAHTVMLSQIPAPTGGEEERVRYILDRFVEAYQAWLRSFLTFYLFPFDFPWGKVITLSGVYDRS